jgi:beta-RFAP synthase
VTLRYKKARVSVPARINAMVFDTKSLVSPEKKAVYTAGELIFSAKIMTTAKVAVTKKKIIVVSGKTHRKSIALHAARIMQKTLGFREGLTIEVNNMHSFPHCGFGSSGAIQVSVAIAINALFGNHLKPEELMKLLSQNYGEEISGNDKKLVHVQSNGGALAAALFDGGMLVLAGEAVVVKRVPFPKNYSFVFGIPKSYQPFDAKEMMSREEKIFGDMAASSKNYSEKIAWNVLHKLLPALVEEDMYVVGEVIDDYRFNSGSLSNDGKMWPEMLEKMRALRKYRNESVMPILSTSSCGPVIFSLTKQPEKVKKLFETNNLSSFIAQSDNCGAKIKLFK